MLASSLTQPSCRTCPCTLARSAAAKTPPHLRRGTLHDLQPRALTAVPLDVAARLFGADIGQAREPRLEPCQLTARGVELQGPVPARLSRLLQVGMRLAPRPRLHNHAELTAPRGTLADRCCLRRLVTPGPAIEPAHTQSMRRP
jgi:hypothetical protein